MCPVCLTTIALAAGGGTLAGGLTVLAVRESTKQRSNHDDADRCVAAESGVARRVAGRPQGAAGKEKELTRHRDAVNAERRRLPMVKLDKQYRFDGPGGTQSLLDLFEGRCQLIVYHFMFDPAWAEGCPSCSLVVDNLGHLAHLHARRTSLAVVSRAPLATIEPFKRRMGWSFPWYSSSASDFNYDFHVTHDEAVAPVEYNYLSKAERLRKDEPWFTQGESHGLSVFLCDGESVFHTYSTYARGADLLVGTFNYLDLTPLGRQEDWEEPPGRSDGPFMHWVRRHDRYSPDAPGASAACCGGRA